MIDIRQASSEPLRFCQPPSACGSADDADSLKARNRLGGRAFTSRLAGTEVELGGGFVHWVPAARLRRADSLRYRLRGAARAGRLVLHHPGTGQARHELGRTWRIHIINPPLNPGPSSMTLRPTDPVSRRLRYGVMGRPRESVG
jgi:hypothetical protein